MQITTRTAAIAHVAMLEWNRNSNAKKAMAYRNMEVQAVQMAEQHPGSKAEYKTIAEELGKSASHFEGWAGSYEAKATPLVEEWDINVQEIQDEIESQLARYDA